jgi:hypothetical protein
MPVTFSQPSKLPYPIAKLGTRQEEILDWALSVLASHIDKYATQPEAFNTFENLVRLRVGTTIGSAVQKDLEELAQKVRHLEIGTNMRRPHGQKGPSALIQSGS